MATVLFPSPTLFFLEDDNRWRDNLNRAKYSEQLREDSKQLRLDAQSLRQLSREIKERSRALMKRERSSALTEK
jgi:hypothetical protein